jgi:hypothetical protein
MKAQLVRLTCEIEPQPGETLRLPDALLASIGPGRWRLTVRAVPEPPPRSHAAFLNGYAPEDERLYDAYPAQ